MIWLSAAAAWVAAWVSLRASKRADIGDPKPFVWGALLLAILGTVLALHAASGRV